MTIDQQSELITNSLCSSSHQLNTKLKEKVGKNLDYVYVLLGVLCFTTIAISTIFVWYAHQFSDLSVLKENLKDDLIVNDIKQIVRMVLKDIDYQPLYEGSDG